MLKTPYPEVNGLLDSLLSQMRYILGEKLIGLYLYGSLTAGGFSLRSSDIDLLAVTSDDVDDHDINNLREMHRDLARSNKDWDDRIDVAYLSVTALGTFRSQSSEIAVISPGEPFHLKQAGRGWLMNWYTVRESGVALFGPPPEKIIGEITEEEFVQAVREHAAASGDWICQARERKAQAYAILTMCRALYTIRNREQVSKTRAALWVQKYLPEWSKLIRNALVWRRAWRDKQVDHAATYPDMLRFVGFVRDRIV